MSQVGSSWQRHLILVVFFGMGLISVKAQAKKHQVVILLDCVGTAKTEVGEFLPNLFQAEITKLSGWKAIPLDKELKEEGLQCSGDVKCLAAVGRKAKATDMLYVVVNGAAGYTLDLKHIAVRSPRQMARVTEDVSGTEALLSDGVRGVIYALVLPEKYFGSLQVDFSEPGASVFVDEQLLGVTPELSNPYQLKPGKHALRIAKDGFSDYGEVIDIKFDKVLVVKPQLKDNVIYAELIAESLPKDQKSDQAFVENNLTSAKLSPEKGKSLPRWPAYAALAVGGALTIGGIVQEFRAAGFKRQILNLQGDKENIPFDKYDEAKSTSQKLRSARVSGAVLLVTGVAVMLGGGTYWYFTPTSSGAQLGVSGQF
jgi:hypothetical protein